MADERDQRSCIRRRILRYLLDHPAATDSADGIRDWWLGDLGSVSRAMVVDELEKLLRQGWLETRGNLHGAALFALHAQESEAVRRYLEQAEGRLDG